MSVALVSRGSNLQMDSDSQTVRPEHPVTSEEYQHFSIWSTFKHHIPRFLITILVDLILPTVIYFSIQKYLKSIYVLFIAGIPPLIMIFIKGILSRTFDALGFLVIIAFLISVVVAILTHNAVVILLEKSVVTGILSIIFAVTLIPLSCCRSYLGVRPLAYYFYQDLIPISRDEVGLPDSVFEHEQETTNTQTDDEVLLPNIEYKKEIALVYQWFYTNCSSFRSTCYIITSIWSAGFLLEFFGRLTLILIHLPINKIILYGHIILSLITVIMILLTVICIVKERKKTMKFVELWKKNYVNTHQQE